MYDLHMKFTHKYYYYFPIANAGTQNIPPALRDIEAVTCLKFRARTDQQHYLKFFQGQGCYSYVGNYRQRGGQTVSHTKEVQLNAISDWQMQQMQCWESLSVTIFIIELQCFRNILYARTISCIFTELTYRLVITTGIEVILARKCWRPLLDYHKLSTEISLAQMICCEGTVSFAELVQWWTSLHVWLISTTGRNGAAIDRTY